jgi:hypothetical protein
MFGSIQINSCVTSLSLYNISYPLEAFNVDLFVELCIGDRIKYFGCIALFRMVCIAVSCGFYYWLCINFYIPYALKFNV